MSDFEVKEDSGNYQLRFTTDNPELLNLILNIARWCVDKEENDAKREKAD